MTKSKLLKILNNYDSQSIVISLCDYYKLELDKIKSHIEKNGFFSFDKTDYITKTIKIADIIAFAESKDNFNGNVQIDDNIRYNEDKLSIFDIARNIDKYLKTPPIIFYDVYSSKKDYEDYYAEHKDIIRQRTNGLISLYKKYLRDIPNLF